MPTLTPRAAHFAHNNRALNTLKTYAAAWRAWERYAVHHSLAALPADPIDVANFLTEQSELCASSTLDSRLAAIKHYHRVADLSFDDQQKDLRNVIKGIKHEIASIPKHRARPLLTRDIEAILAILGDSIAARRDRFLILIGFLGALRSAEIVGLDWQPPRHVGAGSGYIEAHHDHIVIHILRSKTDPRGRQDRKIILRRQKKYPLACPVRAAQSWRRASKLDSFVFCSVSRHQQIYKRRLNATSISAIVRRRADDAGLNIVGISSHSLRAGHATSAAAEGVSDKRIMRGGGWRKAATLHDYQRMATADKTSASALKLRPSKRSGRPST